MDIITIISLGAISIQAMLFVIFVILNNIDKGQDSNKLSEPDNPLILTIQAMEVELAELKENNIHMERIAQLEKDIEEARVHAEALSKIAGEYGSSMEEVGEQMSEAGFTERVDGGRLILSPDRIKDSLLVDGVLQVGKLNTDEIRGRVGNKPVTHLTTYEKSIDNLNKEFQETQDFILKQQQDTNRKIIEELESNLKNTVHDAFNDEHKNIKTFGELIQETEKEQKEGDDDLRNLLIEASKKMHKSAHGQWNTIPRDGLSHEERANKFIDRWVKNEIN